MDNLQSLLALFSSTALIGVGIGYLFKYFNLPYIWSHGVDRESSRHGGELVAAVLKAHGVKYIFTLVGGHISPILTAAERAGIQVIDTRHEVSAVFAADAIARLSGSIGVAAVTAGPGLTNTITAVKNAQMAEVPLLLISGAAASLLKGRGALQDIDQMSLVSSVCKYCVTVTSIRNVVPLLKKAIQEAQSDTPGPVFVEFPVDVLYPYYMVEQELIGKNKPRNLQEKVMHWYLNNYVENIFAGAWESYDFSPFTPKFPVVPLTTVQKCARLLSQAKKPLIIVGSQVTLPPVPAAQIQSSLESMGFPCFLTGMARGLLGRNSKIQIRQKRKEALKDADVIVLFGTVCDFRLNYGKVFNKQAKIISVNRNKSQLMKNSGVTWRPTVAALGDVGTFIKDLSGSLATHGCICDPLWLSLLKDRDMAKEEDNVKMADAVPEEYLNPMKFLLELEEMLPENAILVNDGGDFVGTAAYILRPRAPLQWLDPGAFGTLGVGGGFALGAKLYRPDAEVWIIYGDGSCGYSLFEYDTFLRHKTPVISVVGNDGCWSQIAREQVPIFGSSVACDLLRCDYHKVVEALGGVGLKVTSTEEIKGTLLSAQKLAREGKSVLVNAFIGKSNFRDGSISV